MQRAFLSSILKSVIHAIKLLIISILVISLFSSFSKGSSSIVKSNSSSSAKSSPQFVFAFETKLDVLLLSTKSNNSLQYCSTKFLKSNIKFFCNLSYSSFFIILKNILYIEKSLYDFVLSLMNLYK